ncbi:hypothetical protein [Niabella drilacis]|uniref:Uncharacterized protein n=1 Tax=Niabella drilacis (strain DSM 25811 / CCM 8410 / CCUG 62505 / LMG 26954 / E90) TaxID=1285928 RepID=A0A1G6LL89_NIADE|nr:hypothetical protein [Niabella drilacis]SDC43939.1 hypothetical protein SAMN04487894_102386 [Niabella drilacis]
MKENRIGFILLVFLAVAGMIVACTNPFKDLEISVSSNVFKNVVNLEVNSSAGTSLDNATVVVSGPDAGKIYNAEGKKIFKITGGFLFLAVDPNIIVSEQAPLNISVAITAANHLGAQIPVKITGSEKIAMRKVVLLNTTATSSEMAVKNTSVALAANGTPASDITVNIPPPAGSAESATILIPAGTQFRDANNNVVSGTDLKVSLVVPKTGSESLAEIFPGGTGLTQPAIQMANGTTSGTLLPGGMSEVSFTLNGTAITNFSKPVDLGISLDPDFVHPGTGQKVKGGDKLSVFSFSSNNPIWKHEQDATVQSSGGKLTVNFSSTHATWFMAGGVVESCDNSLKIKLTADWLKNGVTHPVTVKVYSKANDAADKLLMQKNVTATDGSELSFDDLPKAAVIIKTFDADGNGLSETVVADPCNATLQTISLAASPVAGNPKTTMQLYVRCPNQAQRVNILPTFYLYYKIHGQAGYKLLGIVTNGYISTTLLDPGKKYDFRAVWGSTVKDVNDVAVKVDNTATVGDNAAGGEILGTRAGATNLELLKEKCKEAGL